MTAPPSTETPHTATPWRASKCGYLMGTDDSEGAKGREVQVGKIGDFFDKQLLPFNKDRWQADLEFIVTAANSHASLTARIAELTQMLKSASSQCGNVIYNCEQRPADNQRHLDSWKGVKQFIDAALDNADGGRG